MKKLGEPTDKCGHTSRGSHALDISVYEELYLGLDCFNASTLKIITAHAMSVDDQLRGLEALTVVELRKRLSSHDLSTAGSKKELLRRLATFMKTSQDSDTVVPAEIRDNVLEPVDDALELDAPDSDVETGDTSAVTVISPPPRHNGHPESTERRSSSKDEHRRRTSTSKTESPADVRKSDERPASRRRQWGSSTRSTSGVISISTDSLEKLVPTLTAEPSDTYNRSATVPGAGTQSDSHTVQTAPANSKTDEPDNGQVELEVEAIVDNMDTEDIHQETKTPKQPKSPVKPSSEDRSLSTAEVASPERAPVSVGSRKSSPERNTSSKPPSPHKRKGPKETKAVGYLVESPERVEPCQPAKHKPTNIVYIRSLVRPFTVDQLRQMISDRFGPVDEIWLDRIKSSSLVRMNTLEAATKCREGLDGSRWPSMNPRVLRCDFGNEALFDWMKANGASGDLAPPRHLVLGQPDGASGECPPIDEKVNKGAPRSDRTSKRGSGTQDLRTRLDSDAAVKDASPRQKSPVHKQPSEPKKKQEEPAKLLDDLFRKTESTPCIYWLPLTDDERSTYVRSTRPSQRATRSPFTSPGPNEATGQKATERSGQSSSAAKTTQPDRSEPSAVSKNISKTEVTNESKSKPQRADAGDRSRKKSPAPLPQDSQSGKRDKCPTETRKRERSPFTPPRTQPSAESRTDTDKSSRPNASSSSVTKRARSRSPSTRRSQPSKTDRFRRSSSRSSTGRSDTKRRTTGSSSRRNRRTPPSSSKYTRERSRSVERRAISPPTHRSYGRSHR
ncbi:SAP domain protein [Opisthorchis viverrini]|uniref:SAP domain protein n=1 Tax=Opisthorchis viverrini TaxID=6198 RepID=A0A1S8WGH7_OPIVI|nr:SAP domain protein [Opisthorchis viverrini]